MGRSTQTLVPFTKDHVLDKDLMVKILKAEEELWFSDWGQDVHKNKYNFSRTSLMPQLVIQRKNLMNHGFDVTDASIQNYRSAFRTYWNSPTDYDEDIMNAVHYLRNNRILYYTSPILHAGDNVSSLLDNIPIQDLEGNEMTLKTALKKDISWNKCLLHAFSMS